MSAYDWYPANHTYTGDPGGRLVAPHYETMPDRIRVFDWIAKNPTLVRRERQLWRKARTAAFDRWGYWPEVIELKREQQRPQGIVIGSFVPDPLYGPNSYGGFGLYPIARPETSDFSQEAWDAGKGWALIHPKVIQDAFTSRTIGRLAGTITHEVGHAFGFGHGGTGVMRSVLEAPYHPNAEELKALRAYWGRA